MLAIIQKKKNQNGTWFYHFSDFSMYVYLVCLCNLYTNIYTKKFRIIVHHSNWINLIRASIRNLKRKVIYSIAWYAFAVYALIRSCPSECLTRVTVSKHEPK